MNVTELLQECRADGVEVTHQTGQVFVSGSADRLTKWRPVLATYKAEILAVIAGGLHATSRARAALFIQRGMRAGAADELAMRLALRDRQCDERRVCMECAHLTGTLRSRRCAQWRKTGMPGPPVSADLVDILQRCRGFETAPDIQTEGTP